MPRSKLRAENCGNYFCPVKFSTQVLISLWKSWPHHGVTSGSSTFSRALHYLCATSTFFCPTGAAAKARDRLTRVRNWISIEEASDVSG
jgi:hypothetical protein